MTLSEHLLSLGVSLTAEPNRLRLDSARNYYELFRDRSNSLAKRGVNFIGLSELLQTLDNKGNEPILVKNYDNENYHIDVVASVKTGENYGFFALQRNSNLERYD